MAVDNFFALTASMARSPKTWLPALLLGAALGHAPSAQALVIFDNTNNLSTASSASQNSQSGANKFVPANGGGTAAGSGISIPLIIQNSLYLTDISLQITGSNFVRSIGFFLYEATPSTLAGSGAGLTQLYVPNGAPLTTDSLSFAPSTATANTNNYNTFNFSGTNLGSYLLTAGKTYLLVTGNVTAGTSLPFTYGAAATEAPNTTNLITWNNTNISGNVSACTPAQCKSDTLLTNNGGQNFSRNATTSSLIKLSGYQAVPAPLPLMGAGLAFGYSRRMRRRILGEQASA